MSSFLFIYFRTAFFIFLMSSDISFLKEITLIMTIVRFLSVYLQMYMDYSKLNYYNGD